MEFFGTITLGVSLMSTTTFFPRMGDCDNVTVFSVGSEANLGKMSFPRPPVIAHCSLIFTSCMASSTPLPKASRIC